MWSSEETIIPYISPKDNKYHRYFMDFKVWIKKPDGEVKVYLVEIKPDIQTRPPKPPKKEMDTKRKRRFLKEHMTWAVNEAKWNATLEYCKKEGFEFKILTEKNLT